MKTKQQAVKKALFLAAREGDCFLRQTSDANPAGHKFIHAEGRTYLAHRLVYDVLKGCVIGKIIRHSCGRPNCINPDHLLEGTHADNMSDKVSRGRQAKGAKHGQAKLTESEARLILVSAEKQEDLAFRFGVSRQVISGIKNGRMWTHLREDMTL